MYFTVTGATCASLPLGESHNKPSILLSYPSNHGHTVTRSTSPRPHDCLGNVLQTGPPSSKIRSVWQVKAVSLSFADKTLTVSRVTRRKLSPGLYRRQAVADVLQKPHQVPCASRQQGKHIFRGKTISQPASQPKTKKGEQR